MENSIEAIWKQGFLNEKSLVAPKINDLYNQRSMDLVDKMRRMYKINIIALVIMAIIIPIMYYFFGMAWEGLATSILLLLTVAYSIWQKWDFRTIDHGTNSLDYLRSLDRLLKNALSKGEKIFRFSYPLYFLIAISAIWSAWSKQGIALKIHQKFSDLIYIGDAPLIALIIVGLVTLLMLYFSDRIYRWDVRLIYGRVFDKLKNTIAEMEQLKQED